MDVKTGHILAMVGSRQYDMEGIDGKRECSLPSTTTGVFFQTNSLRSSFLQWLWSRQRDLRRTYKKSALIAHQTTMVNGRDKSLFVALLLSPETSRQSRLITSQVNKIQL
jgi:cell division protein FtsI/penicillin-binding protein 2